jgi:dTDP-4-dehydrorhamnose 3,5-epimerase
MDESKILILGGNGQLGNELRIKYPNARSTDIRSLDITDTESIKKYDWKTIEVIINAAAYTNVDGAETAEGRKDAWLINAQAVYNLAKIANKHNILLIHISTDYVFDGTKTPHTEEEGFSPLSVYGSSKAAGDIAVLTANKYYLLRTSWVIGKGRNFVRTMIELGQKGVNPTVVSDQIGRLTFTSELVRSIDHLLTNKPAYGTYNVSNEGPPTSWAEITKIIYKLSGLNNFVTSISTNEYYLGKNYTANRPLLSIMALDKLHLTGFISKTWETDLRDYLKEELS